MDRVMDEWLMKLIYVVCTYLLHFWASVGYWRGDVNILRYRLKIRDQFSYFACLPWGICNTCDYRGARELPSLLKEKEKKGKKPPFIIKLGSGTIHLPGGTPHDRSTNCTTVFQLT